MRSEDLVLPREGELSAKLTEGEPSTLATVRAHPSVARWRTRHLPLAGEDEGRA
jgi:hypothetical protein